MNSSDYFDYHVMNSRDEWLKQRTSTIGGSDASCIMGLNPWKTNIELWEEKIGIIPKRNADNDAIRFGNCAEPLIRELFTLEHPELSVEYVANNIYVSKVYPFAHASLDGWFSDEHGRRGILEIKTGSPKNAAGWEEWKDRIPDRYYCQILHYFAVTNFDYAILKAYLRHYDGNADCREYIIEKDDVEPDVIALMQAESKFCEYVRLGKKPHAIINI